jgi:hypothetical protein
MPPVGFTVDMDSVPVDVNVDVNVDEPETNVVVAAAPSLNTTQSDTIDYKVVSQLFELAQQEEWSALVAHIQSCPAWLLHQQAVVDPFDGDGDVDGDGDGSITSTTLLHCLVATHYSNSNVPETVIQAILDKDTRLACLPNHMQQTPLHVAVQCIPDQLGIIQCLIYAAPETAQQRDGQYLRPIDVLCQTIIMKEERIKYNNTHDDRRRQQQQTMVNDLWECARMLAQASRLKKADPAIQTTTTTTIQPTVHACLHAVDFPLALIERAMKRYMEQLGQADAEGDLPLHIMARQAPPPPEEDSDDGDDDDDGGMLLLDELVSLYPPAAAKWNHQRQIPLDVAIASGRRWRTGIRQLLEAHPAGIESRGIPLRVYPLIFEKLIQEKQFHMVFGILQGKPELYNNKQVVF